MTISQKMIGQSPKESYPSTGGKMVSPRTNAMAEWIALIKVESFKNLIANGTVPILFSSIVADGTKDMIEKIQFKSPLTA